ncbi:hypothetical protein Palpr_1091 [Paludibacter propionicigenes WB4]|uniref:Uncharacterized protein n=1 Tax=Paludibacter propionicigenes (strain DSM 17365 / JCM 13257 / WB4) TaxID=694427 RepID=E4T3E5_PALPW|nr:hypothetical protein [Paludibacter propionicigenes]ADQ79239.1 hypothetical protein Palpr_1091 [Paludibacter propionicigenes WB4]
MFNFILSGLRMFVFTPVMFVLAVLGILICIFQDVVLFIAKTIWNLIKAKQKKDNSNKAVHLT